MLAPKAAGIDWAGTFELWGSLALVALFVLVIGGLFAWARNEEIKRKAALGAIVAGQDKARWDALAARFGPESAVRIWRKVLWQGETAEMLTLDDGIVVGWKV